jgi:hypothetical protein
MKRALLRPGPQGWSFIWWTVATVGAGIAVRLTASGSSCSENTQSLCFDFDLRPFYYGALFLLWLLGLGLIAALFGMRGRRRTFADDKQCVACGRWVVAEKMYCPYCGEALPPPTEDEPASPSAPAEPR